MKKSTMAVMAVALFVLSVWIAGIVQAAALATERDTPQRQGESVVLTVMSNALIYAGALVCVSNEYARPAADVAGYAVIGRAEATVDNRGALYSATKTIKVTRGVFRWANADSITAADLGKLAYVTDDQTVNKTGGGAAIIAGAIIDVDSSGVWVDTAKIGPSGAATPSSLAVTANATVGGTLAVTGASTLTGNTAVGGTLAVTGASTLTGATTLGIVRINGALTLPANSISNSMLAAVGIGVYTNITDTFTNVFDSAGRLVSHDP